VPVRGIGIDVCKVERISESLKRFGERMEKRLFTPGELAYCRRFKDPLPHLAARFAAKEAVVKALGLRGFGFREIEVVAGEPPTVRLSGAAAEAAAGRRVQISLTHSRDNAAAVAIAERA